MLLVHALSAPDGLCISKTGQGLRIDGVVECQTQDTSLLELSNASPCTFPGLNSKN